LNLTITGVDLSKVFGRQPKYWGEKVSITDEIIGVSQLLGVRALAAPPQVYACAYNGFTWSEYCL